MERRYTPQRDYFDYEYLATDDLFSLVFLIFTYDSLVRFLLIYMSLLFDELY